MYIHGVGILLAICITLFRLTSANLRKILFVFVFLATQHLNYATFCNSNSCRTFKSIFNKE